MKKSTMKIQIISDLHLTNWDCEYFEVPHLDSDVTILAGDIGVSNRHQGWVEHLCDSHNMVLYVMGNHEYYGSEISIIDEYWREFDHPNYKFLQMDTVEISGIKFAGCTLWTDFGKNDPEQMNIIQQGLNDYRHILYNGERVLPETIYDIHLEHKEWLMKQEDVDVMIVHHSPTIKSIAPQWEGDRLNNAFVSDCEDIIEKVNPKLCIHGHTHTAMNFYVGDTEVVCNPRGYSMENTGFDINLVKEI